MFINSDQTYSVRYFARRTRIVLWVITSLIITLLLTACGGTAPTPTPIPAPTQTPAPTATPAPSAIPVPTTPEAVVQAYYDALTAEQLDTALAFVADDAIFFNPIGLFSGAAEIREHLQNEVIGSLTFDLSNLQADGGKVTYAYEVIQNGSTVDVGTDGLTVVQNGKIVFDGTVSSGALLCNGDTPPGFCAGE